MFRWYIDTVVYLWYNKDTTIQGDDIMPQIIPIRDLKNTSQISEICHSSNEPVFVTKNGYGDMVIMSMEAYEKAIYMNSVYEKLSKSEESVANGNVSDAAESIKNIRRKYEL